MKKVNNAQTILSIVVGFLVLFLIFKFNWMLMVAVIMGVLGLFSDYFSGAVTVAWTKFAQILGRINGNILLTVVFFVFLTPIALLMRLIKKPDHLKLEKQTGTIYEIRNHTYTAADMENIW